MKFILADFALATVVHASCWPSISCHNGGDDTCNRVCIRQGNLKGGRCLPRDGCPGSNICACFPRKRSADVVDGDEALINDPAFFNEMFGSGTIPDERRSDGEASEGLVARSDAEAAVEDIVARGVEDRSPCCSLLRPFKGVCCDQHCARIGKPGGQCSEKDVCTCN